MLSRKDSFESIKEKLEFLQLSISNSGSLNINDLTIYSENFFRDLLNLVYGWQLENANAGNQNAADIDLADQKAKLAIQVTARNDHAKIAETLGSFYSKTENSGRRLKFMLISKEAIKYKAFEGHEDRFDPAEDIIDIKKLLRKLNDLRAERLDEIAKFLEREVGLRPANSNVAGGTSSNEIHNEGTSNITLQGVEGSNINIILGQNESNQKTEVQTSKAAGKVSQKFYPAPFIPDLKYFVGRKELLANLRSTLQTHHKASIHDISGLGKTFVCYKFAADKQDDYSKIFFVNCAKEVMMESLARLGLMLNPGIEEAAQDQQAMAFKNWLETNEGWLAIYDNVDLPFELNGYVPNQKKGDCIFTSNFDDIADLGEEVNINKLSVDDSRSLLFNRKEGKQNETPYFKDAREEEYFEKLIKEIDGLPLALSTTGAFIRKKKLKFKEFWRRFEKKEKVIIENEDGAGVYQNGSALRAFLVAFEENTTQKEGDLPGIAEVVKLVYEVTSFISPDNIPEEFLRSIFEKIEKELEVADSDEYWEEARVRLCDYDLFKIDENSDTFSTHRLVQKTIQSQMPDEERITLSEGILNFLAKFFPQYDYNNKPQCERYYQHTLTALENAGKAGFEADVSVVLYFRIGEYQRFLGNYGEAEKSHEKQFNIAKNIYGDSDNLTAIAASCLALVYESQGRLAESENIQKEAIAIGERSGLKDTDDQAGRLNNLAMVYEAQGKYDEAVKLLKQVIKINLKVNGKEHRNYATSLNNLAGVYDSQSKYDEAVELYKQAMEITGKTLGKEHPDYANRLNNLAVSYFKIGNYSEALPLFEEALRIFEAKLPPEHPYIAIITESIKNCQRMLGHR